MSTDHATIHKILGFGPGAPQQPLPKNKIVLFGNDAADPGYWESGATYDPGVDNPSFWIGGQSAFRRANAMLGCPFTEIINKTYAATTYYSADLVSRVTTDVIANSPGWVLIAAGANDFWYSNYINNGSSISDIRTQLTATWANIKTMVTMCLNAGIRVILQTPMPRNGGATYAPQPHNVGLIMLARKMREYCAAFPNIILLDAGYHIALYDSATHANLYYPDTQYYTYSESANALNLNSLGGQVLAQAFHDTLSAYLPRRRSMANGSWDGSTGGDVDNGIANSTLVGSVAVSHSKVTGFAATGWDVDAYYTAFSGTTAVVAAKGTHWDGSGALTQKMTVTGSTAPPANGTVDIYLGDAEFLSIKAPLLTLAGSQFAVGDTVFAEMEVNTTETSGTALTTMMIVELYDASSNYTAFYAVNAPMCGSSTRIQLIGGKVVDCVLRTNKFVIPASTVSLRMFLVTLPSTGGNITWEIARPQLCKVQTY